MFDKELLLQHIKNQDMSEKNVVSGKNNGKNMTDIEREKYNAQQPELTPPKSSFRKKG